MLELETLNIHKNSPTEKQDKRINRWQMYYGKVMPFLYMRFFGIPDLLRKVVVNIIGIFRPIVYQVSESDMRVVVHKTCALAARAVKALISQAQKDRFLVRATKIPLILWQGVILPASLQEFAENLVLNGHDDWYLPSRTEMHKLYLNKNAIGGFMNTGLYWTSTENGVNQAFAVYMDDGSQGAVFKSDARFVRAIRSF